MRFVITLLAMFAFSLHLLLGCCAHHAHGEEGLPGHHHEGHSSHHLHLPAWLAPATDSGHDGHNHSHDGHQHNHEQDSQPTPHVPCTDPDCVFIAAAHSVGLMSHDLSNSAILPLIVIDLSFDGIAADGNRFQIMEADVSPHVRRHLALARFLN